MQPQRSEFDPSQLPPRIASKIAVGESGCWIWQARLTGTTHRYGYFKRGKGQSNLAHRMTYELLVGPIPEGLEIDHLCRNPPCVNPAHLEPVTHKVNMERAKSTAPTHCPRGHEYTFENMGLTKQGWRKCRACARQWARARARLVPKRPRKRKTHCKHGHEYTPENTRVTKDGVRVCKTCHRNAATERYHRLHPDAPYTRLS